MSLQPTTAIRSSRRAQRWGWVVAAAFLTTLALGGGILFEEARLTGNEQFLIRAARDHGRSLASLLAARLAHRGCSRLAEAAAEKPFEHRAVQILSASPEISYLYVVNPRGEIVWSSSEKVLGGSWQGGVPTDFLEGEEQRARIRGSGESGDADVFVEMITPTGPVPRCGAVVVSLSEQGLVKSLRRGTSRLLFGLIGIFLAILIALGLVSRVLARRHGEAVRRRAQAEHLAEIGLLAAGLAHELRNPLNAMHFAADSLALRANQLESHLSGEMVEITQEISQEVSALDQIVRSFLSYARPSSEQPEDVDITSVARSALAIAQPEVLRSHSRVSLELPDRPVVSRLLQGPLRQVLVNLLQNAAQACGAGDTITLRVAGTEESVRFEVEDDGPGVPFELRKTLFQPFTTGRRDGTGLGLAICRRLVTEMGGAIRLEQVDPRGSRFVVELPRRSDPWANPDHRRGGPLRP